MSKQWRLSYWRLQQTECFDWLSNMGIPQSETFGVLEVRFKVVRKNFSETRINWIW